MITNVPVADAASFADFLRRIGHRVVATPTVHWFDVSPLFFLSAPPHRLYAPTESDVRAALRHFPCLGVRFAAAFDGPGKESYQIVCDDPEYDLERLSGNVRSKVRRGLKRCRVERLSPSALVTAGRRANDDTVARQGRVQVRGRSRWEKFCAALQTAPGFEVWGAWCGADLAAFLVTVSFEDGVEFMLARSRSDLLGAYPNNALVYAVTREMLVDRRVPRITFGLESLEPVGPLDEFKFSMGFREQPLRQRLVFHPLVRRLLQNSAVRAAARRWVQRRGRHSAWRKADGLLRFAEEGGM